MDKSRKRPRASSPKTKRKRSKLEGLDTNSVRDLSSNSGSSGVVSFSPVETPTKGIQKQLKGTLRILLVTIIPPDILLHPETTLSNRKSNRKRQEEDTSWYQEDAEFLLPEEGENFVDVDNPEDSHEDNLPVRYLDNFTIYDEKSGRIIGLDDVEESDTAPYFEGAVRAKLTDDEAEEEDLNPHLLRSSTILSVWQSEEVDSDGTSTDLE
jgi:hypothetical protein